MINFKKIATILGSTLMVGSTMAMAAAANYPAPFVQGGGADVAIVFGANGPLDIVAASNINTNLASALAGQTATGSSTSTSVTGGDSKILSTSARKLYYGDAINAPISSLSYTELGVTLADETFTDLGGTTYDYTQTITLGNTVSVFGTSGGDLDDPALYLDVGTAATDPLYNYTLSFNKNLNVSDSTNVQGQKIKILGVDYVIGASSTNATLYLYGSGETLIVAGGEEATVSIAGVDHTVSLVETSSATAGTIKVDGVSKSVTEGSNYGFSGDLNVYVKNVIHPAYAGDLRQAELIMGANTLKLVNGQSVKEGAEVTSIKGTKAVITKAGTGIISGLTVQVALPKSKEDDLSLGDSFTDPVFGGIKMNFASTNPGLDSETRENIIVSTDNSQYAYVTFTSARAGSAGEQKLTYVYDNNTASTAVSPLLAHQTIGTNAKGKIHVYEGEDVLENDWVIVNQGDAGTILEVTDISHDTATSGTVSFEDAITGEPNVVTLSNSTIGQGYIKSGVNMYGGTGYKITTNNAGTAINITWSAADTKTLFPRIQLANGGWLAFLTQTEVVNGTDVIFPNGLNSLTTTGTDVGNYTVNPSLLINGLNWTINSTGASTNNNPSITGLMNPICNFNTTVGPAILVMEPKKWNDASFGDYICTPLTTTGTTEIAIARSVLNGSNSGFVTWTSDTYKSSAIDAFGTLIDDEQRTNENGVATISYPTSQMYFEIIASANDASVSSSTSSSTGVTNLGYIIVTDDESASVNTKNLIVVGGSCVNSVAAELLEGALCGDSFTEKTGIGAGQYLIQTFENPSASDKVAMLVAGYDAADTTKAAIYLVNNGVDASAGKKYVGTSITSAELQTTTA
jgi:hypothetical protein